MAILHFFKGKDYKLIKACKKGNIKKVKELLNAGVDVNSIIEEKRAKNYKVTLFPLYVAVSQNNYELVKMLLENGANVNKKDQYGSTSLHIVNDENILKLLLQNDADIHARDSSGMTAVEVAGKTGKVAIGKALFENGATVEIKIKDDIFTINKSTYDKTDIGLKSAILKLESLTKEENQILNKGTGNAIAEAIMLSIIVERLKDEILPTYNKIVNIAKIFFSNNNAILQLNIPYFRSFYTVDSADIPEITEQFSQILKQIQVLKSN